MNAHHYTFLRSNKAASIGPDFSGKSKCMRCIYSGKWQVGREIDWQMASSLEQRGRGADDSRGKEEEAMTRMERSRKKQGGIRQLLTHEIKEKKQLERVLIVYIRECVLCFFLKMAISTLCEEVASA